MGRATARECIRRSRRVEVDTATASEHGMRCRQMWAALILGLLADASATGRGSGVELLRRHARTWFTTSPDRGTVLAFEGIDPQSFETRTLPRLKRAWAEADEVRFAQERRPDRPRHEGQAAA